MKRKKIEYRSVLKGGETFEGETIEERVRRITLTGEPIKDGAPIIYTEKADGVLPQYNIKTDKWDVAVEALDLLAKTEAAKGIVHPATIKAGEEKGKIENQET